MSAREKRARKKEVREEKREGRQQRRQERRETRGERREERQTQRQGSREERRTQRAEHREERQALRGAPRQERQAGRQQRRQERRETRGERREERQTQRQGSRTQRRTMRQEHREERQIGRISGRGYIHGSHIMVHFKILTSPGAATLRTWVDNLRDLYEDIGLRVDILSRETIRNPPANLNNVNVGNCRRGQVTANMDDLYNIRGGVTGNDLTIYFVQSTVPPNNGCAAHPRGRPGVVVAATASQWTLAHEIGHVLDLNHVNNNDRLMTRNGTFNITNPPPDIVAAEARTVGRSRYVSKD